MKGKKHCLFNDTICFGFCNPFLIKGKTIVFFQFSVYSILFTVLTLQLYITENSIDCVLYQEVHCIFKISQPDLSKE